ncbi:response regulator [Chloroflexota bacterium]
MGLTITKDYYIILNMTMDKLLTTKIVAEYLNVKPITVRRKAQIGEIPSIRIGNRLRFDKKQIDKWLLQRSNVRPVHILVVDDEPSIGQLFIDSLSEPHYQVTTTVSSLEALELIDNIHFDIICLDLDMPELSGAQLFYRIRMVDKDIPVAIITGSPVIDLMIEAMEYGPFMVLKKPFTSNDIIGAFRSLIQGVATSRRDKTDHSGKNEEANFNIQLPPSITLTKL